jgi:hypothetical protein
LKRNSAKLTVEFFIIFGFTSSSDICIFLFSGFKKTSATPIAYAINISGTVSISDFGQSLSIILITRVFPFESFLKRFEKIFFSFG